MKKLKMPDKTIIAIGALTIILITCLFQNIDGALIGAGVAAIAGLGGYIAGKKRKS